MSGKARTPVARADLRSRVPARERTGGTPRDMRVPGSEDWCWATLHLLKVRWAQLEDDHQLFEEVEAEIEAQRVWERVPPEHPYGSKEALLKAELGVDQTEVRRRVESSRAAKAQAMNARDRAQQRPPGRPTETVDNVHSLVGRPAGNTSTAALRRLRTRRPDLHARVLNGELSPHAAMVEAGFRPRTISVPLDVPKLAAALHRHLSTDDVQALAATLTSSTPAQAVPQADLEPLPDVELPRERPRVREHRRLLDEVGDAAAPPGSREWALWIRLEIQGALKNQEVTAIHLRSLLRALEKHQGYAALADEQGAPFTSYRAFCVARIPFGLGRDPELIACLEGMS